MNQKGGPVLIYETLEQAWAVGVFPHLAPWTPVLVLLPVFHVK